MNYVLIISGDTIEPNEVKVPKSPDYWVDPPPNTSKGGANIDQVDNPGGWSSFYYPPLFLSRAQGGSYKAHFLPTGCHPLPPNEDNTTLPTHKGWNFMPRMEERGGQGCGEGEHF